MKISKDMKPIARPVRRKPPLMPYFGRLIEVEKNTKLNSDNPIPEHLQRFFWDVSCEELKTSAWPTFIIGRLMEHGDEAALRFLFDTFSRDELRGVLLTSRSISRRSRKFWALILDVEEESCIAKRYPTPFGDCSWD